MALNFDKNILFTADHQGVVLSWDVSLSFDSYSEPKMINKFEITHENDISI